MVEILKLMLGRYSEDEILSRFVFELVTCFKEITLIYQGLQAELNLRVRCAFGSVFVIWHHGAAEKHNMAANVACYEQDNTYRLRAEKKGCSVY